VKEYPLPFSVEPTANNHFAWVRTLLGLQRTHMAAVRTAVALIGFGFTVAEFFRHLQREVPETLHRLGPGGPRDFGLVLIAAGVASLAIFTLQYSRGVAYLRSAPFALISGIGRKAMTMPVYLISYTVIAIGLAAFLTVLVRA
jgi:putative membrane protein